MVVRCLAEICCDHLAVVGGGAEHFRIERYGRDRLALERLGEFARGDFRPLVHADLIEAIQRRPVVGTRRLQHVQHVLGVAHVGEIGLGNDQDIVRADQRPLGPGRPLVGNVEHDAGGGHAQRIEDRIEGVRAEIIDLFERRRRRQQAEAVGAFRQQALHQGAVGPVLLEHRIGDALDRILVVVEAGGAERQIEVDDDGIQRQIARDRPGHVVCDGGGADAALGADDRDDPADGDLFRRGEQAADRPHHVERLDRAEDVVADAAADQFAVGRDITGAADHDDPGAGVANGCEFIEAGEHVAGAFGLQHDHVRRRRLVIGVDGGGDTAHVNRQMGLVEAAVFARRFHRGCGGDSGAKGLHRHARRRRDVIVRGRRVVAACSSELFLLRLIICLHR